MLCLPFCNTSHHWIWYAYQDCYSSMSGHEQEESASCTHVHRELCFTDSVIWFILNLLIQNRPSILQISMHLEQQQYWILFSNGQDWLYHSRGQEIVCELEQRHLRIKLLPSHRNWETGELSPCLFAFQEMAPRFLEDKFQGSRRFILNGKRKIYKCKLSQGK